MSKEIKIEEWNGYNIRFVEKDGEWWAVLKDICEALGLQSRYVKERIDNTAVSTDLLNDINNRPHKTLIVNEFGIYDTIFQSRKKEAKEFRYWVYEMLKTLREKSGLEGFEVFRMLDKDHQKEMMKSLSKGLRKPVRVDFIKANTIANKAISNKYGYERMVKKADMTAQMLIDREPILEDTVELMKTNDKFNLGLSVSKEIYRRYQ